MKSYVECCDEDYKVIGRHYAPFDVKIGCYNVNVYGNDFNGMKLRGKCDLLVFNDEEEYDFNKVDLSGFMELEIGEVLFVSIMDKGLLKMLELNCKGIMCEEEKLDKILNKYVQEEPDPLMRDIQGCKYELAINGYGDRL